MATTRNSNKLRGDNLTAALPLSPSLSALGTADMWNKKLNSLRELIAADVRKTVLDSESRIMEKISDISAEIACLKQCYTALEQRVSCIESVNVNADNLRAEIADLHDKCVSLEDEKFLNDVVVSGVPYSAGENLGQIFDYICKEIDLDIKPCNYFRANSDSHKNAPIIYKLSSPHQRIMLLKSLANLRNVKKRALKLSDFAMGGENNLFIYESLSKSKREILEHALKFKRNGKFTAAYSFRGKIYVRLSRESSPVIVTELKRVSELANST